MDYLLNFSPWQQALFATLFTWGVTALESALVFAFKTIRSHALALMYGFAAGVMIAASFWSLLDPAINLAEQQDRIPWLVVGIGFVGGGFFPISGQQNHSWYLFETCKNRGRFPSSRQTGNPVGLLNYVAQYSGRIGGRCRVWGHRSRTKW